MILPFILYHDEIPKETPSWLLIFALIGYFTVLFFIYRVVKNLMVDLLNQSAKENSGKNIRLQSELQAQSSPSPKKSRGMNP